MLTSKPHAAGAEEGAAVTDRQDRESWLADATGRQTTAAERWGQHAREAGDDIPASVHWLAAERQAAREQAREHVAAAAPVVVEASRRRLGLRLAFVLDTNPGMGFTLTDADHRGVAVFDAAPTSPAMIAVGKVADALLGASHSV